jgi:membrane-associated phospholipid phosphatase
MTRALVRAGQGAGMLMPTHTPGAHSRVPWVVGQAVIVVLAVFFYFQVRGLTEEAPSIAFRHAHDIMELEQRLGLDQETALQAPVVTSHALETLANWVYIWGHWPVIVVTMFWLAWRHRREFLRLRDAMLISGAMGLVVFVTYPVAPPRLVDNELIDTVTQNSHAYRVLQPPNFVNQYAAMPSLHAGWDLLVGISIATAGCYLAVRAIGWVLPVLMTYAVVATANHFVVDVIVGLLFALIGLSGALLLERRRERAAAAGRHRARDGVDAPAHGPVAQLHHVGPARHRQETP